MVRRHVAALGGTIMVPDTFFCMQKFWMECIGMVGGPVRAPCAEMTEEAKAQMRADLEATGLIAKAKAGAKKTERRAA